MSCLTGRHLSNLVGHARLTLDAGLAVVAMRDDRSIGNLRVEARNPRERTQERNPAVLRSRTEASLGLIRRGSHGHNSNTCRF